MYSTNIRFYSEFKCTHIKRCTLMIYMKLDCILALFYIKGINFSNVLELYTNMQYRLYSGSWHVIRIHFFLHYLVQRKLLSREEQMHDGGSAKLLDVSVSHLNNFWFKHTCILFHKWIHENGLDMAKMWRCPLLEQ